MNHIEEETDVECSESWLCKKEPQPNEREAVDEEDATKKTSESINSNITPRMCRICFVSENDEDIDIESMQSLGRLISPCKCSGSMKHVHLSCLNTWRKTMSNSLSYFNCDQCGYKYNLVKATWAAFLRNQLLIAGLTLIAFLLLVMLSGFLAKGILMTCCKENLEALESLSPQDLENDADALLFQTLLRNNELFDFWAINNIAHFAAGLIVVGLIGGVTTTFGIGIHARLRGRALNRGLQARDFGGAYLVVIVAIGTISTLWVLYKKIWTLCVKGLAIMEILIVDVNDVD